MLTEDSTVVAATRGLKGGYTSKHIKREELELGM